MGLDNPIHIAFLLILLLLVFGAKRLPEMGRSLGDGMRGFKDAISGEGTPTAATATPPQTVAQPVLYAQQEPVASAAPAHATQEPVQAPPVAQTPHLVMEKLPA
jgi:sec-independent protein translocase protein TatA